ncbi:MAG: hypothetical protein Q9216_000506 [Gyalolechia sp. 2 TL-2023]
MDYASSSSTSGRITHSLRGQRRSNSEDLHLGMSGDEYTEDEEAMHGSAGELLIPPIYDRSRYVGPRMALWSATGRRRIRASTVPSETFQTMYPTDIHQNGTNGVNGTNGANGVNGASGANGSNGYGGALSPSARTSEYVVALAYLVEIDSDLNSVIMDYLISEGYPSAAQKFASEANIQPTSGVESIQDRVEIRDAIHAGDIQTAIERINELNPMRILAAQLIPACKLLDRDNALHFALLRLQLIELIRTCSAQPNDDFTTAIEFAETQLATRAPTNPKFLDDLERTMTLLMYDPRNLPAELAPMLEPQLRKDVAQSVNEALLREQGERTKARLFDLVRLRAWSERKAREANKDLPEHLGLGLDGIHHGRGKERDGGMHSNGEGEAMVA